MGPEGTSVHCLWWVSLWWKLWLAVIITELLVTGALLGVVVGSRWVVMAGPSVL